MSKYVLHFPDGSVHSWINEQYCEAQFRIGEAVVIEGGPMYRVSDVQTQLRMMPTVEAGVEFKVMMINVILSKEANQ